MKKLTAKVYKWLWKRQRFSSWIRLIWRFAHWCPEMDGLLVLDNIEDCFCGYVPTKIAERKRYRGCPPPWLVDQRELCECTHSLDDHMHEWDDTVVTYCCVEDCKCERYEFEKFARA